MTCCPPGQASIQAKIWKGYGIAAGKLGSPYLFSRPANGNYPGDALFTRNVALNAEDMKFSRPNKYGKPTWYALVDGTGLEPGDYFTGGQGTFFVAALQPLLPILAVECNRTASFRRVSVPDGFGAQGYGGATADNEAAYASGVPCSILQGTKGEKNPVDLPGDTRLPWWAILMPASVGGVNYGDIAEDDLGRRYMISSSELTDLGYRCTAMMTTA